MIAASELDWSEIYKFDESEFNHVDLTKISGEYIKKLGRFRKTLGYSLIPSPNKSGWARESGSKTSRHYAIGRLADAGDLFPKCHIAEALIAAIATGFGGIGIYLDTTYKGEDKPMIHTDDRPLVNGRPVIWLRDEDGYETFYPHKDPAVLCKILKKLSEVK